VRLDSNPKNILALDTSCGVIAACIIQHGHCYEVQQDHDGDGKTRSTSIVPILGALLTQANLNWQQLDMLALGAGPGSFTGLRIAAATLAGINAGLRLPVLHLSSLAITAMQAETTEPIRVLEDARAGEVFSGYYQQGNRLEADACLSWAQVETFKPGRYCCHNEPPVPMCDWKRETQTLSRSRALALVTKAAPAHRHDRDTLPIYPSPVYLQLSQAERNANGA